MKKTVNKKISRLKKDWKWLKCSYVWYDRPKTNRIVYYEWTILNDLWDTVLCEFIDKYILVDDTKFNMTLEKKQIKLN